jgi:hypothetical protein
MEKSLRCTVCFWRGTWTEAQFGQRVVPTEIPQLMVEQQAAYEESQVAAAECGEPKPPACPGCGHHTVVTKRRQSIHPAM